MIFRNSGVFCLFVFLIRVKWGNLYYSIIPHFFLALEENSCLRVSPIISIGSKKGNKFILSASWTECPPLPESKRHQEHGTQTSSSDG